MPATARGIAALPELCEPAAQAAGRRTLGRQASRPACVRCANVLSRPDPAGATASTTVPILMASTSRELKGSGSWSPPGSASASPRAWRRAFLACEAACRIPPRLTIRLPGAGRGHPSHRARPPLAATQQLLRTLRGACLGYGRLHQQDVASTLRAAHCLLGLRWACRVGCVATRQGLANEVQSSRQRSHCTRRLIARRRCLGLVRPAEVQGADPLAQALG